MFILSKFSALIYEIASNKPSKMKDGGAIKSNKLLAPNGKPTNLTPQQYAMVRTPEFKNWFGDWENDPTIASKVVDENGEPMVVYHGAAVKNKFYNFNIVEGGDKKSKMQLLFGSHFASTSDDAKIYTKNKGSIYEVFLNIKNLLNLSEHYDKSNPKFNDIIEIIKELKIDKKFKNSLDYTLFTVKGDYGGLSNDIQRVFLTQIMLDSFPPKKVFDVLKNKFDGILYIPYQPQGFNTFTNFSKSYIAFHPTQIKLADGTNTAFNPKKPNIRFEDGGELTGYNAKVQANLKHMGTSATEWSALPIIGEEEIDVDGKDKKMPLFDFTSIKGYAKAPTLFPQSIGSGVMNCELCSKLGIKTAYYIKNDSKKFTLIVGSECVTHFGEGKSGKQNMRQFKIEAAKMLDSELTRLKSQIYKAFTFKRDAGYGRTNTEWRSWNIGPNYHNAEKYPLIQEINPILLVNPKYPDTLYWDYVYANIPNFNFERQYNLEARSFYIPARTPDFTSLDRQLLTWYTKNEKLGKSFLEQLLGVLNIYKNLLPADFDLHSDYLDSFEVSN
jgi:hypothetical protein